MYVMGIVNVTPDSFSDGGKWSDTTLATSHARDLAAQGAEILDIGGESTRPGATALSGEEEWMRIGSVVEDLASANLGALISIDTYHADTARRAIAAGAHIVNDVTGGHGDPDMFATVAQLGVDYILQHGRGNGETMNSLAVYHKHVALEVRDEILRSRDEAVAAGIDPEKIILDPGLGFAKTGVQDWDALAGVEDLMKEGHRVLVGASRKRFLAEYAPAGTPATERDLATAVLSVLLNDLGIWAVRVHDVLGSVNALRVRESWAQAQERYRVALAGAGNFGAGDEQL